MLRNRRRLIISASYSEDEGGGQEEDGGGGEGRAGRREGRGGMGSGGKRDRMKACRNGTHSIRRGIDQIDGGHDAAGHNSRSIRGTFHQRHPLDQYPPLPYICTHPRPYVLYIYIHIVYMHILYIHILYIYI